MGFSGRYRRPVVRVLGTAGLAAALLQPAAPALAAPVLASAGQAGGGVPAGLLAAVHARGLSAGRSILAGKPTVRWNEFGDAVAISGNTAVVGAVQHFNDTGAAFVFTRRDGVWHQQAEPAPDQAGLDLFGASVAISGSTIAVGSEVVQGPGQVYVFTRTGSTWARTARLQASDGVAADQFGAALALSGTTLVIGAPGGNWTNNKAYVFSSRHGHWTQAAELTAANGQAYDNFGRAVALSGNTAVVGAPGRQGQLGAAYVYTGSRGGWTQQAELTATGGQGGDQFGASVAILGTTALIGAPQRGSLQGAAYLFTESDGSWSQRRELPGPVASPVRFGNAVALAPGTAVITTEQGPGGIAFVYRVSGNSLTRVAHLPAPVGPDGFFGSVAVSGTTAVIGAPSLNHFTGIAYVFSPL